MIEKIKTDATADMQAAKNGNISGNTNKTENASVFSDKDDKNTNINEINLFSLLSNDDEIDDIEEFYKEKLNTTDDIDPNVKAGLGGFFMMDAQPKTQEAEKPNPFFINSLASYDEVMKNLPEDQKNALINSIPEFEKNNLNINDANFDVQSNGEVIVVFPNDSGVYKIDANGNLSKLDSSSNKNEDGSSEQTYTYQDEDGNTYTRTINYNENGSISGSSINVKDNKGHETKVENYNENGEITSSVYSSGFIFGDEPMSVQETTYKDGKKTYEKFTGPMGGSVEEKYYDENGVVSHSTRTEYSIEGNPTNIIECNYENGIITSRSNIDYYDDSEVVKSRVEEHYENGELTSDINIHYSESGEPTIAEEKQYENGKKTYYKTSCYDNNGNIYFEEESYYDSEENRTESVKTSYDENGNKFITKLDNHCSITENKEIYQDEQGNRTEVVTTFDESGKIVKTVSSYDKDGNLNMTLTTSVGGIDSETLNSMPAEQQNAINDILQDEDISSAVFDVNDNGEVIITFPNSERNTIKIDANGNKTELETVSYQNDDGSHTKTYTETDENGNTYTRTIEFDSNDSIQSLKYEDNNGEISTGFSKFTSYCNAYTDKKDDSFVVHNSPDEALNPGDICKLDNGKIGIRLEDGSIQELNISEEALNRLFPPDSAMIFNQGHAGDCYLVSTLYTLLSNPATKAIVLSCFTENEDGSITVKLPNGNVSFTLNPGETTGDYVDPTTLVNGCEGIRMLEHLCGMEMVNIRTQEIMSDDSLTEEQKIAKIKAMYGDINDESEEYKVRGNGGMSCEVYNMFGLESGWCTFADEEDAKNATKEADGYEEMIEELLLNPDNWDDYVFGAGSLPNMAYDEYNPLVPGQHAYSITPYKTESGEIRFIVTNPWDTSTHFELTYEELKQSFLTVFFAKIK